MDDREGTTDHSIVIPVCNEEETLPELVERLTAVIDGLGGASEVIFVDDCSRDGSNALMRMAVDRDPRFKLVRLSRNFGQQAAICAGLDMAQGRATVIMDADLQDPPELIPQMLEKWREGYEVVYAIRAGRDGDSRVKRMTSFLYYRAFRKLVGDDVPVDVGDFRLVGRRALEAFKASRDRSPYVRGLFSWVGFDQASITYRRDARFAGRPKYSYSRSARLAVDGVVGFTNAPLRLALRIGVLLAVLSFVGGLVAVGVKLSDAAAVPGWTSLVVVVSFLGGIQLMILGVIGEYIARIFDEVKPRPLYLVEDFYEGKGPDSLSVDTAGDSRPADPARPRQ